MRNEYRTTQGKGNEIFQPTVSTIDNTLSAPRTPISKAAGNAVVTAGSPVQLSFSLGLKEIPSVGDEIFCYGFSTAGNNGRFTITAVNGSTLSFVNGDAGNETLALTAAGNVSIYHTPQKTYQDVAFTSGIPNCTTIAAGASGTLSPIGGVYSYLSASNGTDVTLDIKIANGTLRVPAGSSIGHEIRPFTSDVTCDASAASTGGIIINIS